MSTQFSLGLVLTGVMLSTATARAEDLGIVRVVTRPAADKSVGHFTATHLGDGLLLTCGHCCRHAGGAGVLVDVRVLSREDRELGRTEPGVVLCHDESVDLGFIRLTRPEALMTSYELAPRDISLATGQPVLQYTWKDPAMGRLYSVRSFITQVNLFQGPQNIETKFAPVQGDSGAPLVDRQTGTIIGVTTGADYWNRFGVHTGITAVYDLATRCRIELPRPTLTPGVIPASRRAVSP